MGLALLILGIVLYKNWKMIVIGAVDMLLTVAMVIWGFVFLLETHVFHRQRVVVAQRELNYMVRQMEFYKFENGKYPGDLWELNHFDHGVFPVDPTQEGFFNNLYNYQNFGDHYTLFSVGPDGIPHTSDDIFPVVPPDTGRVHYGWIKP